MPECAGLLDIGRRQVVLEQIRDSVARREDGDELIGRYSYESVKRLDGANVVKEEEGEQNI